jgi:acetyl esterase/lipase
VRITVPPDGVPVDGPIVVLVHGGAWFAGSPALLDDWADALAAEGAVVFNASYHLAGRPGGGYPGSLDDVACAIRFARAEAPAYTDADQLVVVGHSAGGHLGAVVALDPAPWGGDCAYPPAEPPDRFVGLAGIYDVSVLGGIFDLFLGGPASEAAARLAAVDPVQLVAGQDDLEVVLITGSDDDIVPPAQASAFADALPNGARTHEILGADHLELQDPDVVGVEVVLEK